MAKSDGGRKEKKKKLLKTALLFFIYFCGSFYLQTQFAFEISLQ